jgi:hemolysin type calcium-binding protein
VTFTRLAAVLSTVAALAASATVAAASTDHTGWPVFNGHHWSADSTGQTSVRGTPRNDELLGGAGSDTILGRGGNDVIWGTRLSSENNTRQHDVLDGGPGRDFIYASKGRNDISGGPGNDVIHAHYGTGGTIDCGPGNDIVYLSHRSAPHYVLRHCEHRSFFTAGH